MIIRYRHGKIIEINSHSLFSKWFSESGKLVQKLFQTVTEMVEDESGFVVVMIGAWDDFLSFAVSSQTQCANDGYSDEVESLTAARAGAMKGNEPSDSLRVGWTITLNTLHGWCLAHQVVNALLTQLDKLRTRKNVLVMTTSNLVDAIGSSLFSSLHL